MKNTNPPNQAHHGALNYRELDQLGIDPADVLDFSSNINPYGPPSSVYGALQQAEVRSYPDRDSLKLKHLAGDFYNIPKESLLFGNGASELIWLLCFTLVQPGDPVLVLSPTFSEYSRCASLMGAVTHRYEALPEDNFNYSLENINLIIGKIDPRLVFICNPNNPTGTIIDQKELLSLIINHPQTIFVIDEAYIEFTSQARSLIGFQQKNLIVLRSLTKYYALAGLRLGFIYSDPEYIQIISASRPAWNINAVAQVAGAAAINAHDDLKDSVRLLVEGRQFLVENLNRFGYRTNHSSTHYFLANVQNGAEFRHKLLTEYHIQVRDCASFGLPAYIRISPRLPEENQRLIDAVQSISPGMSI